GRALRAASSRRSAAHARRRVAAARGPRVRAVGADRRRAPGGGRVGGGGLRGEPRVSAPEISVVIPAYNEAESLPALNDELIVALTKIGRPWEIVYVDDGSRDGTDEVLGRLAAADPRVRAVSLRRNFGKSAGLGGGSRLARRTQTATRDGDVECDPAVPPELI